MEKFPKLSYFHHIGSEPLKAMTLGNLLEISATKFPHREAVISRETQERITYQELLERADKFAAGLQTLGLQKGDRVGLWAPNIIEWCVVNMALVRGGFYMVALNPYYEAPEMEYSINTVGIKMMICPYKIKHQNFYDVLTKIAPELKTNLTEKLNNKRMPSLTGVIIISDEKLYGTYKYNDIMELADFKTIMNIKNNQHLIRPDDACYIMYSSGTTGEPKATVLSHFQIVNNAFYFGKSLELHQIHHKMCVQIPLFHIYGATASIVTALHFGSTMVLPSSGYSPIDNLKAIEEETCTIIYGTPAMYVDLIDIQNRLKEDICLEIAHTGAAYCSPELYKKIKTVLNVKKVKISFGMTESSPIIFQCLAGDEYESKDALGHVGDHLEVKVVDENGTMVPMGTPGELCVRGYSTMLGYWNDDKKTKDIIGPDRWLKTGDLVILQDNGYAKIVGRLKDLIIRGGENIIPREIEDIIGTHPNVSEVHVIGLPHERLGEEVCACVKLTNEAKLTQKSLAQFLKGKISFHKIPSQLKEIQEFPKTASGKIKKQQLKQYFTKQEYK